MVIQKREWVTFKYKDCRCIVIKMFSSEELVLSQSEHRNLYGNSEARVGGNLQIQRYAVA